MDTTPTPPTGTSTTAIEQQLADYVAEHRQHLPQLSAAKPSFSALVGKLDAALAESPEARQQREAKEAQRALTRQRGERQGLLTKLIQAAGNRYATCTLDSYRVTNQRQQEAVRAVAEYADMLRDAWESSGLVLYGPIGTGKDHLAFAVASLAITELGKRVEWVNGQAWFGQLRDNMDKDIPEAAAIGTLARPDLLVLSDPLPPAMQRGDELTAYQATMLYRLVDARYSRGVPTIVTLNVVDDSEAYRRIGAPTWDRLCHDAWKIACNWPSYRKPKRIVP